jgi:hypothetical protein
MILPRQWKVPHQTKSEAVGVWVLQTYSIHGLDFSWPEPAAKSPATALHLAAVIGVGRWQA